MAPLNGFGVLITRPRAQAEPWAAQLQALGAVTEQIPVLALAPLTGQEQIQAIKNRVLDFDLYHKAIFVSRNAVDFGLQWLEDFWPQLPQGIEYFAVGETTAHVLQARGLTVSALLAASEGAMNSESLLQAPELQHLTGQKIVIFRGLGGRGHMGDILRARGAQVDYCEVYQRNLPPEAHRQLAQFFTHKPSGIDDWVLVTHSGESLQNLLAALGNPTAQPQIDKAVWLQLPLLVPGERVAALARAEGFEQLIIAENATDPAMTRALITYCQESMPSD